MLPRHWRRHRREEAVVHNCLLTAMPLAVPTWARQGACSKNKDVLTLRGRSLACTDIALRGKGQWGGRKKIEGNNLRATGLVLAISDAREQSLGCSIIVHSLESSCKLYTV